MHGSNMLKIPVRKRSHTAQPGQWLSELTLRWVPCGCRVESERGLSSEAGGSVTCSVR